jgi:hypothetical protein
MNARTGVRARAAEALTLSDEMRALAQRLTDEADRHERRGGDQPLATDVLHNLVPHARLTAAQAKGGLWWAYLLLPKGATPKNTRGWALDPQKGAWWADEAGDTEVEATRKVLHLLVDLEWDERDPDAD